MAVRRTDESGKFQKNLQKSVAKRIILMILISSLLFLAGQFSATLAANELNASNHLKKLEEVFLRFDRQNREFLLNENTVKAVEAIIEGEDAGAADEFKNYFRRFDENCDVRNQVIITNTEGEVLFTSFGENQLSSYLVNYNNAVCYNARNCGEGDIYRAVYYDRGNYADALFIKPIFVEGEITGYITLFLSGSGWNFYLSESNFDGVITDLRQNVMYISKPGLADSSNKFYGTRHGSWTHGQARYWVVSKELPEFSAIIYSLVYYPGNETVYIGLSALFIMGAAWYGIARWMAKSMAENNAASIERLVSEIRIIRKGDYDHRIQMNTDDEFTEVGYQVNHMLDSIQALNDRNTELLKLNSRIEMDQLTAQMNPHFLYNTMDMINWMALQGQTEEISHAVQSLSRFYKLTLSRKKGISTIARELEHVTIYVQLQNMRYHDSIELITDIPDELSEYQIPKLTLQPVVENSILHNIEHRDYLSIDISGKLSEDLIILCVKDNGTGMTKEQMEQILKPKTHAEKGYVFSGLGVCNVEERIRLAYGPDYGLEYNSDGYSYTEVTITFPRHQKSDPLLQKEAKQ